MKSINYFLNLLKKKLSSKVKILGKKKLEIVYRWKVEGSYTSWTTYKNFKTRKKLEEEIQKLSQKDSEFVEYRVA